MGGQSEQVDSDLMTFERAAAWLGLDKAGLHAPGEAVRYLCRQRKIRHIKIGKRVFIRPEWLEDYLNRESVAPLGRART